jgi:hypothetical protein
MFRFGNNSKFSSPEKQDQDDKEKTFVDEDISVAFDMTQVKKMKKEMLLKSTSMMQVLDQ